MRFPSLRHVLAFGLLTAAFAAGAHAQYVWLNENGRKHYSDMPPPPSVPQERILKQTGRHPSAAPAPAKAGAETGEATPNLAERDAEFRRRRLEKAEQEQKAREEAQLAAENRKRCERLREYQGRLESGVRLARRDASGERAFLSDEDRRRELKDTRRMLAECKS